MSRTLLNHRFPYIALGYLSLLPPLALAIPTLGTQPLQPHTEKRQSGPEETCGFLGDDNTYGLGIRLGVYLQWIAFTITYRFIHNEAANLRGVINCFQAATLTGLFFITITKGSNLYAVEAYMVLIFYMGGVITGDINTEKGLVGPGIYGHHRSAGPGGIIRFFLSVGFCIYGMWFFFTGMDGMQHTPCSTSAFFFGRVNLYGWIRTLMKVVFLLNAITHVLVGFRSITAILLRRSSPFSDSTSVERQEGTQGENQEGTQGKKQKETPVLLISGTLVTFILTVEFMIKWNNIQGVNKIGSTGQLLPLVVAIAGLLRVLYKSRKRVWGMVW